MSMIGTEAPDWSGVAYLEGEQTEICGFQALLLEFAGDGIEVIGASTDSFFSHKAWFQDRQTFPDETTHPVKLSRGEGQGLLR